MSRIQNLRIKNRKVDLFIPSDNSTGAHPILVMHDGQNIFYPETCAFGTSWETHRAVEELRTRKPKPIIVGIWNRPITKSAPSGRGGEYAPADITAALGEENLTVLPGHPPFFPLTGKQYEKYVTQTVLPEIYALLDSQGISYRTDAAGTAIAGSSMGGLASLNLVAQFPEIFGTAISFSTHWTMGGKPLAKALIGALPDAASGHRVWLDRGTLGIDAKYSGPDVVAEKELTRKGYRWPQVECRTYVGTSHNEIEWQNRFPDALAWWLDGMPAAPKAK